MRRVARADLLRLLVSFLRLIQLAKFPPSTDWTLTVSAISVRFLCIVVPDFGARAQSVARARGAQRTRRRCGARGAILLVQLPRPGIRSPVGAPRCGVIEEGSSQWLLRRLGAAGRRVALATLLRVGVFGPRREHGLSSLPLPSGI